jgi:glucokinase
MRRPPTPWLGGRFVDRYNSPVSGSSPWSVLAIDLGGSQIRAARIGRDLALAHRQAIPTMAHLGVDAVLERLTDVARSVLAADAPAPVAVGISMPGPLDSARGVASDPLNLPGWHEVPVAQVLTDATGLPAILERDTKVALLAEWRHGSAQGAQDAIYITVSTGIGGALVVNGQLVDGARGLAGEVGHLTVDLDGPDCGDGAPGHLEAIASGVGLARDGAALAHSGESPALAAALAAGSDIDARAVFAAADAGDPAAGRLVERAWRAIGATCAGLVNLLNPQVIVLGGSIADHRPDLHEAVRATIASGAFPTAADAVRVVGSHFGADVSLVGAVPLITERLFEPVAARSPA